MTNIKKIFGLGLAISLLVVSGLTFADTDTVVGTISNGITNDIPEIVLPCSPASVSNGTVNSTTCSITCNSNYTLNGTTCVVNQGGGGGGGGGGSPQQDSCPNGDYSSSLYDSSCGTIPTTGTITTGSNGGGNGDGGTTKGSILGSTYSTEFNNAYLYAYSIGITTMGTIQDANLDGNLIRAHMAKMMVNYAIKVLEKTPNTGAICEFNDITNESTELQLYIKLSCQLGLMGQGITDFDPNGEVTRAQFGTVMSRILYGDTYNTGAPYYANHLKALKDNNIITNTTPDLKELRGYVMLMLMRAVE